LREAGWGSRNSRWAAWQPAQATTSWHYLNRSMITIISTNKFISNKQVVGFMVLILVIFIYTHPLTTYARTTTTRKHRLVDRSLLYGNLYLWQPSHSEPLFWTRIMWSTVTNDCGVSWLVPNLRGIIAW
jgi:hypothetical protein